MNPQTQEIAIVEIEGEKSKLLYPIYLKLKRLIRKYLKKQAKGFNYQKLIDKKVSISKPAKSPIEVFIKYIKRNQWMVNYFSDIIVNFDIQEVTTLLSEYCKKAKIAMLRQLFYYIAREFMGLTLHGIGKICNRDHSSIVHGVNRMKEMLQFPMNDDDRYIALFLESIRQRLPDPKNTKPGAPPEYSPRKTHHELISAISSRLSIEYSSVKACVCVMLINENVISKENYSRLFGGCGNLSINQFAYFNQVSTALQVPI